MSDPQTGTHGHLQFPPPPSPSPSTALRTAPLPSNTNSLYLQQQAQQKHPLHPHPHPHGSMPTPTFQPQYTAYAPYSPYTPVSQPAFTPLTANLSNTFQKDSVPPAPDQQGVNGNEGFLARRQTYSGPSTHVNNHTNSTTVHAPSVTSVPAGATQTETQNASYPSRTPSVPPQTPNFQASAPLPSPHQAVLRPELRTPRPISWNSTTLPLSSPQQPPPLPRPQPHAPTLSPAAPLIKPPPRKRSRQSSNHTDSATNISAVNTTLPASLIMSPVKPTSSSTAASASASATMPKPADGEPSNAAKLLQVLTREKKQRACTNCRKAKLKCLVAPGETDCVRCRSRQEKCAFTPRSDDDWQQNLVPATYAATRHLAQLSAAVHHVLHHLVSRNVIPPFSTPEHPDGLERYKPPDRDSLGLPPDWTYESSSANDRATANGTGIGVESGNGSGSRRKGKRKSSSEEDEDRVAERGVTTAAPLQSPMVANMDYSSPETRPTVERFWNGPRPPTFTPLSSSAPSHAAERLTMRRSPVAPPPHSQPPHPSLSLHQYAQSVPNIYHTISGPAPITTSVSPSVIQHPHHLIGTETTRGTSMDPPQSNFGPTLTAHPASALYAYYPNPPLSASITPIATTPILDATGPHLMTPAQRPSATPSVGPNDPVFSSPLTLVDGGGQQSTYFSPEQSTSSMDTSTRRNTASSLQEEVDWGFRQLPQTQASNTLTPTPGSNGETGFDSVVVGSMDPRRDVVKKAIVSGADATTLVTYFHIHLSQFLYGYQLRFGDFPYIGGPEVITPLILAVECLIASERFPRLQPLHAHLAEEVLMLLKKSPAESWQDFDVAYGTNELDFDGDDPLNAEFGLGPEEIVAACVLATFMTEREEAAMIARSAFRWARGWIKFLSDTPSRDTRSLTIAEITGCVPPERQATSKDMARVWLLCYIVDSTERLQLSVPAPPLRDAQAHCDTLLPSNPTSYHLQGISKDDILLTYHARLITVLNDWRRRFEQMTSTSLSPLEYKRPMVLLAAQVNEQLDRWLSQFVAVFPEHSSLSTSGTSGKERQSNSSLLDITWLFVRMSVNSTVFKCLSGPFPPASTNVNSGAADTLAPGGRGSGANAHTRADGTRSPTPEDKKLSLALVVNSAVDLLRTCAAWAPAEGLSNLSPTYLFFVTLAGSEVLAAIKANESDVGVKLASGLGSEGDVGITRGEAIPLLRKVGEMLFLGKLHEKHVSRTTAKTLSVYADQLDMAPSARDLATGIV